MSDYQLALDEFGITEEQTRAISDNPDDFVGVSGYGVCVGPSGIQGKGLFATQPFGKGDVIMPARVGTSRTQGGKYTNHAECPNAALSDDLDLIALMPIPVGAEITTDYRGALAMQERAGNLAILRNRSSVVELEREISKHPQIDVPLEHYFAKGLYVREMRLVKDTLLTGKIHRKEHICVLVQGELMVSGEGKKEHMKAPHTFVSQPGAKRAIYALTDAVFINIHATTETDLDKLEDELIAPTFDALENTICLG